MRGPPSVLAILAAALATATTGCVADAIATFPGAPAFDRAATDPRALVLADRVIAATGGADRWRALREVRWIRRWSFDGRAPMVDEGGWDRASGQAQARFPADGDDVVVVRELYTDRATAYAMAPQHDPTRKRRVKPLHHTEEMAAIAESEARFPLDTAMLCVPALLEAPGTRLAYVGTIADHEGIAREALDVTFAPADPVHGKQALRVLVDPATYLIAQLEIADARGNGKVTYHASRYIDVDGYQFPTLLNDVIDTANQVDFDQVRVGEPDAAQYIPPKP